MLNAYRIPSSWAPGGWTETGITANCPHDTNTANAALNCPGGVWDTTGFGAMTPTDQVLLNNDTRGWITFDVTADMAAFLEDTANHGWYVVKQNNNNNERIVFWSRESVQNPRLVLFVTHDDQVPAEAPDTVPSWVYAPTNRDSNTTEFPGVFLKNIVIVQFKPSASSTERQTAVDSVQGTVVGGMRFGSLEGHYYVRVTDSAGGTVLRDAVETLQGLSYVESASIEFAVELAYRKPRDNDSWSSWQLNPLLADGQNWALEAVQAPAAWGCSTGDESVRVAVVDLGMSQPAPSDLEFTYHPPSTASQPSGGRPHGIWMASVLAAKGNNDTAMTGVMWRSDLHAYDVGDGSGDTLSFAHRVVQEVVRAAVLDFARIINVSLALGPGWQSSEREQAGRLVSAALEMTAGLSHPPLIVLSAGNDSVDAEAAGFPLANAPAHPRLVVVAASDQGRTLWDGSNWGPLVDVAAPGDGVYTLGPGAAIPTPISGTSPAAALVSGIAGLLLSFDPRLTADSLKTLIVDGATPNAVTGAGGPYRLVNAYESLRLAASRAGAPLCGNHVWSSNDSVVTRRGTELETLFSIGEPASYVNARHVGRRVDVFGDGSLFSSFLYQNGSWVQDLSDTLPDTLSGGTWSSSLFASHDGDSLALTNGSGDGSNQVFSTRIEDLRTNGSATLPQAIVVPVSDNTTAECWRKNFSYPESCTDSVGVGTRTTAWARPSFSPLGDRILVAINRQQRTVTLGGWVPCPRQAYPERQCRPTFTEETSTGVEFHQYSLPSGALSALPSWSVTAGENVYWFGLSEDGKEIVAGVGGYSTASHVQFDTDGNPVGVSDGTAYSNCRVSYRSAATFAVLSDESTQDVCDQDEAVGTISPIVASAPPGGGTALPAPVTKHPSRAGLFRRLERSMQ